MKRYIILLIPTLLLSCSTGKLATHSSISVHAGMNSGGITENTDLKSIGKLPDAFSGATKTGFHAGLKATQTIGALEIESGGNLMQNRQTLTFNNLELEYSGQRSIAVNQMNEPVTIGVPLLRIQFPRTNLKISAGYLMQFNHLFVEDQCTLPGFTLSKRSSGAALSLQANLLTENGRPRFGIYGMLYRGLRIYTDPYNSIGLETPGSSFAGIGLTFFLFSRLNTLEIMKYLFAFLLLVHGSIHLMGFLKAFSLVNIEALELSIGRAAGMGWLVATILFLMSLIMLVTGNESWPFLALAGVAVSVVLITISWSAAKYSLLPNALILAIAAMCFGMHRMDISNEDELKRLMTASKHQHDLLPKKTDSLPEPVRRWLRRSGIDEHPAIRSVWAEQELKMRFKPDQDRWVNAAAEQVAFVEPASFIWKVKLEMSPFIQIRGRDIFSEEQAEKHIRANGLIDIVRADGPKTAEGSLIRYLGELVWYPSAALSQAVEWKDKDSLNAIAIIRAGGQSAQACFTFDKSGRFRALSAMLFMGEADEQRHEWVTEAFEWQVFDGVEVPTAIEVSWMLPEGKWTWLKVRVTKLQWNPAEIPKGIF